MYGAKSLQNPPKRETGQSTTINLISMAIHIKDQVCLQTVLLMIHFYTWYIIQPPPPPPPVA